MRIDNSFVRTLMRLCENQQYSFHLQEYPLPVSQSFLLIRYTNLSTDHKMENKWELSIMNLTSDIFMEAFFGCRVDPNSMYKCLKGSWHKGRFVFRIKLTQPIKLKSE